MDSAPLFKALVQFQGTMQNVTKDKQASTGKFGYSYADIAGVIEAIKEPLAAQGLCYSQMLTTVDGKPGLLTILAHESGAQLSGEVPFQGDLNDPQKFGGICTYYRRYALLAILGLATEDDDANHARQSAPQTHQNRQEQSQRPSPPSSPDSAPVASQWVTDWSDLWSKVLRPRKIMTPQSLQEIIGDYGSLTPEEVHQRVATLGDSRPPLPAQNQRPGYLMTEKQWKTLHEVSRKKKGMDQGQLLAWASQFNPDKTLSELTVQEASEVIGALYELPDNPNAVAVLDASGGGMGR